MVLAERQGRVGRKLLSTGNGRCNLTNEYACRTAITGRSRTFCRFALRTRSFRRRERWPFSGAWAWSPSRSPVAGCIPSEQCGGIGAGCAAVRPGAAGEHPGAHRLRHPPAEAPGRAVPGPTEEGGTSSRPSGASWPPAALPEDKLGGGMDGYQLARQLGHHRTVLYPSLVQVCTDPTYPRGLKGRGRPRLP